MQSVFCEAGAKRLNSAQTNLMLQRFEEITNALMKPNIESKLRNCSMCSSQWRSCVLVAPQATQRNGFPRKKL